MSRLPGTQKHKATTQLIRENCTQSPLIPTLTAGGDVNSSDARVSPSVISLLEHYDNKANDEPPSRQKRSRFSFMTKTSKDGPEVLSNSPAAFDLSLNLSNALASSKGNTGIGRDYWLDDASATKCRLCDRKFTTFIRKHHCRICGKIFCSHCTTFIDGDKFNHHGKMRVCLMCNSLADRYNNDDFSSDEEEEEEEEEEGEEEEGEGGEDEEHDMYNEHRGDRKQGGTAFTISENADDDKSYIDSSFHTEAGEIMLKDSRDSFGINNLSPTPMMTIPTTRTGEAVEISTRNRGDENHGSNDSSDDENEMISFMNNHKFSWPKSVDFKSSRSSQSPQVLSKSRTPHFLTKLNSFKLNSGQGLNNLMNQNKARRRIFSSRFKSRAVSRNYTPILKTQHNDTKDTTIQFSDGFQRMGESYAYSLLKELLVDKKIDDYEKWATVLVKSLKKINNIEFDVKPLDETGFASVDTYYNFTNYIKIKKIQGANFQKAETVEGIVFSKKLPNKNMPSAISNPRIMLITFPIEYEQEEQNSMHFQSLEAVIAQQDQYIRKLVDRIINLRPSIILSSSSVNGLALGIFAEAGLAVAPNCKLTNLVKLSKFTDSTIITSIDILAMKPKLGTCGSFKVMHFKHDNVVKSYFLFDSCPNKIGLTIILRDPDEDILTRIKGCLMIMIYAFANIKLESSFLRDQCLKIEDFQDYKFFNSRGSVSLYTYNFQSYRDFAFMLESRLVSTSPWVKFEKPQILLQLEETELKAEENRLLYNNFLSKFDRSKFEFTKVFGLEDLNITDEYDLKKLVGAIHEYRQKYWQTENFFYSKKWDQFWKTRELTYFDPNYNQNIVFLFSLISKKNSTPCIGPEIQLIDFYWENDFSLGQFIVDVCSSATHVCQSCQLLLKDHYRSYVHDKGKIDIFIEPNNLNVNTDTIMTWSICKKCSSSTPVLPLSDTSYKYSFGKFLELVFWFNPSFDIRVLSNNSKCHCHSDDSQFDFFKEYTHYFSYKNYKILMEYNIIDNLKLITPKPELFWNPVYDYTIKSNHFKDIEQKSENFFQSVKNRLERIKLDGTNLDLEEVAKGRKKLSELKEKLHEQKQEIDLLLSTVYKNTHINEHLKLNIVIREVQELSSFWNVEFQAFAKTFLPSEKDVKKITTFQLDKLFKTLALRDDSDGDNENNNLNEATNENDVQIDETANKEQPTEKEIKSNRNNLGARNSLITIPKKQKSQLILNRIDELNSKNNNDFFWNKSTEPLDEGKVKQLTKFFDTQEYFDQRELEKQKIANYHKYTPKVSNMRPKIEIYKDASDAVNAEGTRSVNTGENQAKGGETKEPLTNEKSPEKRVEPQPEKVSLLKSLTNFWADRSATLWEPLSYPLGTSEHIFVDSDVIVREDEPSSIIAFCLNTADYESKLLNNNWTLHEGEQSQEDDLSLDEETTITDEEKKIRRDAKLKDTMLKKGFHLKYQFEEGYSTIFCKIFFTQQFDALRRKCGISENYVESLARCIKWDSTGGKSGSTFLKTLDQRFIIKELSKAELEAFVHFAPSYFEYFAHVLFHDLPSVLVKIFGFYQIQVKNSLPGGKSYTMDILIMENLFYDRKIDRIFDLKGSMRNRHVEQTGKENEVLLDENMVEYIYESPLFIKENDKRLLRASLWNDTLFLEKMNVMDYSLVVGIDHSCDELIVGIIDCIRTFTWDKKLESWVKEKGLVGNTGVGKEPTVITPKQYKNRFREAMERYILMAPGVYYQGTTNT